MESSPELSVVMPVYNEEAVIAQVVRLWMSECDRLRIHFRMRIYNDGSRDATGMILDGVAKEDPRLSVIHQANCGHGPTILRGYRQSNDACWTLQVDSDNEMGASSLESLWARRNAAPLVIGRRTGREGPFSRKLVSAAAGAAVGVIFGRKRPRDVNCPLRLMNNSVWGPIFHEIPADTLAPNIAISALAALREIPFVEVDVPCEARRTGVSSIRRFKLLRICASALPQMIRLRGANHDRW